MSISVEQYKGMQAYVCENDVLKVTILKDLGGKVASIYYKKQQFEVLFQPTDGEYKLPVYGDSFEKYDTSGWDEMYPTIDKCAYPFDTIHKGIEMPDHGELWSIPWNFQVEGNVLKTSVESPKFDYVFKRSFLVENNTIHLHYEVENIGDEPLYGIWAFHGLLACDEATKIVLENVNEVINVHESSILGEAGRIHSYPVTDDKEGNEYRLDKINPSSANKTEKFYVNGEMPKGKAAITLNNNKVLFEMNFPESIIPYMGIWINEGGFKNEYNCALEPTNGFYDSAEIAKQNHKIDKIMPKEKRSWYLDLVLNDIK